MCTENAPPKTQMDCAFSVVCSLLSHTFTHTLTQTPHTHTERETPGDRRTRRCQFCDHLVAIARRTVVVAAVRRALPSSMFRPIYLYIYVPRVRETCGRQAKRATRTQIIYTFPIQIKHPIGVSRPHSARRRRRRCQAMLSSSSSSSQPLSSSSSTYPNV